MELMSTIVYVMNHPIIETGSFYVMRLGSLGSGWVEGEIASARVSKLQPEAKASFGLPLFFFLNKILMEHSRADLCILCYNHRVE